MWLTGRLQASGTGRNDGAGQIGREYGSGGNCRACGDTGSGSNAGALRRTGGNVCTDSYCNTKAVHKAQALGDAFTGADEAAGTYAGVCSRDYSCAGTDPRDYGCTGTDSCDYGCTGTDQAADACTGTDQAADACAGTDQAADAYVGTDTDAEPAAD